MCNWLKYHHGKLSEVESSEFLNEMDLHFHSVRNYLDSIREAKVVEAAKTDQVFAELFGNSEDDEASASSIVDTTPFVLDLDESEGEGESSKPDEGVSSEGE